MAKRIEYQEMIDLDGYRKAVADAKSDYKGFIDMVVSLNEQMQRSILANKSALESYAKLNTGSDDGKTQQQLAERSAAVITQLNNQKSASASLITTQAQLEKVTGSLISRQEQLLTEYANLVGTSGRVVTAKKRIANELVNLQNQFEKLDKPVRNAANAAKEVTGQYNLLQKELSDARKELKALDNAFDSNTGKLNRNNQAAVALAQKISLADASLKKMDSGMGQYGRNVGNYQSALEGLANNGVTGLLGSLGLLGIALAKVVELGGSAVAKMTEFEQIRGGLKGVTKDSTELGHAQEYLEATADRLGISYAALAESYKGIKVGTRDTALEGKEADRIFAAFTNRLAEVKAPAEKSQRALEALSQMISKGNVQAEELRGQLGDAMPGAFKLFADAAGVSTERLNDMLKNGEVLAVDILPKVADQLERTFTGAALENVESLTGATARLDNQTGLLLDTFNQTFGITAFFAKIKNGISDTLSSMRLALKNGDFIAFMGAFANLTNPLSRFAAKDPALEADKQLQAFKAMSTKMRQARLELLKDEAAIYKNQYDNLNGGPEALDRYKATQEQIRTLQRANLQLLAADQAQARISERESDKKYHQGRVADVVKQAQEMSLAERNALIARYQGQITSDQSKVKTNPALANTLNRDIAYAKEFIKAIQDVNKELEKKDKKDAERDAKAATREGKAAAALVRAAAEAQLQNSLGTVSAGTGTQLEDLRAKQEEGLISEQQYIMARYNITVAGIQKRQALLAAAGKQETDDYAKTQKELAKADADYQKGRADIQEKAFKRALSATKDAISADDSLIGRNLTNRLGDLAEAYEAAESKIKVSVSSRQISENEGEKRLSQLKIQYNEDVLRAIESAADTEKSLLEGRISELRSQGKTEVQIAEIIQLEKSNLDKIEDQRDDAKKNKKIKNAQEIRKEEVRQAELAAQQKKELEDKYYEIAGAAVNAYFDITKSFRSAEIEQLSKSKDYELSLVGDNAEAKAAIEERFDQKTRELKRKQAIADKAQAAFSIVLSTAQAIVKTLAVAGPFSVPLSFAIGALGAIQLAAVLGSKIPEFYKGTDDAPEGWAWTGERGYELRESKQGGKPTYELLANKQLTYLNAHDKIYTHEESKRIVNKLDVQRSLEVNSEMTYNARTGPGGSHSPQIMVNGGITEGAMLNVMRQAFAEQTIEQTVLSDGELKKFIKKKQQHTEWMNKHFSLPRSGH